MRLAVHIVPHASKTEIVGMHSGVLKIRLAVPPVDGKANKALIAFLSARYDTPARNIFIRSGITSRRKIIEIKSGDGLSDATAPKGHPQ